MKKSFFSASVKAMFFGLATIAMVAMPSCKERNTPDGGGVTMEATQVK